MAFSPQRFEATQVRKYAIRLEPLSALMASKMLKMENTFSKKTSAHISPLQTNPPQYQIMMIQFSSIYQGARKRSWTLFVG